jgi:hypothetical protein
MSEQLAVTHGLRSEGLGDIIERVLEKGIVLVGDIKVNLCDVELLTIKIRLLIASVETAQKLGIDWWKNDFDLSSKAKEIFEENRALKERLEKLEAKVR